MQFNAVLQFLSSVSASFCAGNKLFLRAGSLAKFVRACTQLRGNIDDDGDDNDNDSYQSLLRTIHYTLYDSSLATRYWATGTSDGSTSSQSTSVSTVHCLVMGSVSCWTCESFDLLVLTWALTWVLTWTCSYWLGVTGSLVLTWSYSYLYRLICFDMDLLVFT